MGRLEKENNMNKSEETDSGPWLCSKRWILGYMGVLFGLCMFLLRVDFSMAMVCMVKTPELSMRNSTNSTLRLHDAAEKTFPNVTYDIHNEEITGCEKKSEDNKAQNENAEFTWSKSFQSLLLSVYYMGCCVSQIPGGWLSSRFGGKRVVTLTMLLSAACTLLMPVLTRANPYSVLVVRIIMGLASGAGLPAWFDLIGRWIPPFERSKFTAFCWIGQDLGTILAFVSSGVLCAHASDNGWPSIFYVHGSATLLFVIAWQVVVSDSPKKHRRISEAELSFLTRFVSAKSKEDSRNIPWKAILTSRHVWTLFLTHICDAWLFFTLLICLPMFLKDVLNLDIQRNGLYSSLPWVTLALSLFLSGYLADLLQVKGILTTTATRRSFQVIAFLGSGACIVLSGFATCNQTELVIICICACNIFIGMGEAAGYCPNPVDMAPKYAGIIFSISNTLAQIPGFLAPTIVGSLTPNGTRQEWRNVFYICAGLNVFGALLFGSMASGEVQPWSRNDIEITIEIDKKSSNINCSEHEVKHYDVGSNNNAHIVLEQRKSLLDNETNSQ